MGFGPAPALLTIARALPFGLMARTRRCVLLILAVSTGTIS
jgi:hypothetical protein